jgi:hypothetical protein
MEQNCITCIFASARGRECHQRFFNEDETICYNYTEKAINTKAKEAILFLREKGWTGHPGCMGWEVSIEKEKLLEIANIIEKLI